MTKLKNNVSARMEMHAWAKCPDDRDLDEFTEHLRLIGNRAILIDRENRKVLIGHQDQEIFNIQRNG